MIRENARLDNKIDLPPIPVPTCQITVSAPVAWANFNVTVTYRVTADIEWADTGILDGNPVDPQVVTSITYTQGAGTRTFTGSVTGPGGTRACNTATVVFAPLVPPACAIAVNPVDVYTGCGVTVSGSAQAFVGPRAPSAVIFNPIVGPPPGGPGPITSARIFTPTATYNVAPVANVYLIGTLAPGQMLGVVRAVVSGPGGSAQCVAPLPLRAACLPRTAYMRPGTSTEMVPLNNPPQCTWEARDTDDGTVLGRGCDDGCFTPETRILMGDLSEKLAAQVTPRDFLWNPVRGKAMPIKHVIVGGEREPILEVAYAERFLRVTTKHPMITKRGLVQAKKLTTKDFILGTDGNFRRVTGLRKLPVSETQVVYNFELATDSAADEDHMISADGITTGDYALQKRLDRN